MFSETFDRTARLIGNEALDRMSQARVILFGIGGVGSWAAETLVRTGIARLTIVDADRVAESNINRQLPALTSTVGQVKVDVLRQRLLDINPQAEITAVHGLYNADTASSWQLGDYDYIIDAIDSLADKALLIPTPPKPRAAATPGFIHQWEQPSRLTPHASLLPSSGKSKDVRSQPPYDANLKSRAYSRPTNSSVSIPTSSSPTIPVTSPCNSDPHHSPDDIQQSRHQRLTDAHHSHLRHNPRLARHTGYK